MAWKKPRSLFDADNQPASSTSKMHTLDLNRIDEVYEAIEGQLRTLDQWEQNFIESTKAQWEDKQWLSENQLHHLEKIYLKIK